MKFKKKLSLAKLITIPLVIFLLIQGFLPLLILNILNVRSTLDQNQIDNKMHNVKIHAKDLTTLLANNSISVGNLNAAIQEKLDDCMQDTSVDSFMLDDTMQDEFLTSIFPLFQQHANENTVSGAFLVLSNNASTESEYHGFFLRDSNPSTKSTSNTDLLLERGNQQLAQTANITLDNTWTTKFHLEENREADSFFYEPYLYASTHPEANVSNLGYWSLPFVLENNKYDSHKMITYSLPLSYHGKIIGVYGIEMSLSFLELYFSHNDLKGNNNGFVLAALNNDGSYQVLYGSGTLYQRVNETGNFELLSQKQKDFYRIKDIKLGNQNIYSVFNTLKIYPNNIPYEHSTWILAGLVDEDTIFSLGRNLYHMIYLMLIVTFLLSISLSILLFSSFSRPFQQLMDSLDGTLNHYVPSNIKEIDQLHDVIQKLTDKERQQTQQLVEEKERLQIAIESTKDTFFTYDVTLDTLTLMDYNQKIQFFPKNDHSYLSLIHPGERETIMTYLKNNYHSFSQEVRYRPTVQDEYIFVRITGKKVGDKVVGSIRDINDQKILEFTKERDQILDATTMFYKYIPGIEQLNKLRKDIPEGYLLLIDLDAFHTINERFGLFFGDIVIEQLTKQIVQITSQEDTLYIRSGPDRFLILFMHCEKEKVLSYLNTIRETCKTLFPLSLSFTASLTTATAQKETDELICEICAARDEARKHAKGFVEYNETISKSNITFKSDEIASILGISHFSLSSIALNLYAHTDNFKISTDALCLKIKEKFNIKNFIITSFKREYLSISIEYMWKKDDENYPSHVRHVSEKDLSQIEEYIHNNFILSLNKTLLSNKLYSLIPSSTNGIVVNLEENNNFIGYVIFDGIDPKILNDEATMNELKDFVSILQSQLIQNRHDISAKAKSEFLARMSHEIRTPMNGIIGMTDIALRKDISEEERIQCLEKVKVSSSYMLSILNDILDMSRIDSGKMELTLDTFDLEKMLANIHPILDARFEEKKQTFTIQKDLSHTYFYGDSLHLQQILMNLLSNANKYTQDGGHITLNIQETPKEDGTSNLIFTVKDDGYGISEQDQTRIFESFERAQNARSTGTGLGLAISNRLVHLMGGDIQLESKVNEGSTFSFSILLKNEKEMEHTSKSTQLIESFPDKHVLIVEDNALNAEILSMILEGFDLQVDVAENGQKALDLFHASKPFTYDIIFMDIMMPVMNGLEATKNIRHSSREDKKLPIYAMSANAFVEDEKQSIEAGMNGHLSKPIDSKKLLEVLNQVFANK